MNRLPDDLIEYLRNNRLGKSQKIIIRQLARDLKFTSKSADDYAGCYVRRRLRIRRALDSPFI